MAPGDAPIALLADQVLVLGIDGRSIARAPHWCTLPGGLHTWVWVSIMLYRQSSDWHFSGAALLFAVLRALLSAYAS